jgi:hypothetical protein
MDLLTVDMMDTPTGSPMGRLNGLAHNIIRRRADRRYWGATEWEFCLDGENQAVPCLMVWNNENRRGGKQIVFGFDEAQMLYHLIMRLTAEVE